MAYILYTHASDEAEGKAEHKCYYVFEILKNFPIVKINSATK